MNIIIAALLLLCVASPNASSDAFGAPTPARAEVVGRSSEFDAYGREVRVTVYRAPVRYRTLKRFYQKQLGKKRHVKILETRESVDPDLVLDPMDRSSWVRVLRVQSFDYSGTWAAVFVRPGEDGGAWLAVLQRHPPPEVAGDTVPQPMTIPRALFELPKLTPLRR